MDGLYAPWRLAYVKGAAASEVVPAPSGCIFCDYVLPRGAPSPRADERDGDRRTFDRRRLVVTVRERAFVILNKFPYGVAHAMVVPRVHVEHLDALDEDTFHATQALLRETVRVVREEYRPDGVNVGMNVGAAAGAGIAAHCHWHVLPRWTGDVNFLPALANVKVLNEALADTWERLARRLRHADEDS
ncbi:MAG: HIT domain-containing protein [Deltaproteobacteria bacterium]|nr:HIT domain-containing protein [Deltaproteobacteria bacterium]